MANQYQVPVTESSFYHRVILAEQFQIRLVTSAVDDADTVADASIDDGDEGHAEVR
jgi:hypothetical protein